MPARDDQDYRSVYTDLYQKWRKDKEEATIINDDLVFEIELLKQVDINIDYILMLVQKYHDTNCTDKLIIADVERAINSSYELRNKRDLIERFIASLESSEDVTSDWKRYIAEQKEKACGERAEGPEQLVLPHRQRHDNQGGGDAAGRHDQRNPVHRGAVDKTPDHADQDRDHHRAGDCGAHGGGTAAKLPRPVLNDRFLFMVQRILDLRLQQHAHRVAAGGALLQMLLHHGAAFFTAGFVGVQRQQITNYITVDFHFSRILSCSLSLAR